MARSTAELADDSLMMAASVDDRLAFQQLVERHLQRVERYCTKFLGGRKRGEDAAQDVWLRVWSERKRYKPRGQFVAFVLTIARNHCRNQARNLLRETTTVVSGLEGLTTTTPPLLEVLLADERQQRVQTAMLALPEKLREALLLRVDQELSYAEIARIIRRPEVTARSRVFHALKKLKSKVEDPSP